MKEKLTVFLLKQQTEVVTEACRHAVRILTSDVGFILFHIA